MRKTALRKLKAAFEKTFSRKPMRTSILGFKRDQVRYSVSEWRRVKKEYVRGKSRGKFGKES